MGKRGAGGEEEELRRGTFQGTWVGHMFLPVKSVHSRAKPLMQMRLLRRSRAPTGTPRACVRGEKGGGMDLHFVHQSYHRLVAVAYIWWPPQVAAQLEAQINRGKQQCRLCDPMGASAGPIPRQNHGGECATGHDRSADMLRVFIFRRTQQAHNGRREQLHRKQVSASHAELRAAWSTSHIQHI